MSANPRDDRRAGLRGLPDAELLAACVAAIAEARRYRRDETLRRARYDCWAACCDTGREQIYHDALAAVGRGEG